MKTFLVPVHVDPVKPMNPSHLRHVLYADFLHRQLKARGEDVVYCYNRLHFDLANQVIKLASYIEQQGIEVDMLNQTGIGEVYVKMTSENFEVNEKILYQNRKIQETSMTGFPHYNILLRGWSKEHEQLEIENPGFVNARPYLLSTKQTVDELINLDAVCDCRNFDGHVYLDSTEHGRGIRRVISKNSYSYNYLFLLLRELLPQVSAGDVVYLLFDPELWNDFYILSDVLAKIGAKVYFKPTARLAINNKVCSARRGGWQGYTVQDMLHRYKSDYSDRQIGLGLRVYLLLRNGISNVRNFSYEELDRTMENTRIVENRFGTGSFVELFQIINNSATDSNKVRSPRDWWDRLQSNKSSNYFMSKSYAGQ